VRPYAYGLVFLTALAPICSAQQAPSAAPIAIVPINASTTVTGALEVTADKAMIAASGTVTAGAKTAEVALPHRGVLRVCASTTVKLASDTSVPSDETPGLVMSLDRGALEMSFATGKNADILLTPDFRILIGGPGAADVKVRLGEHGDTCVENDGVNAPYVLVSSVFDGGAYRVQTGQRVLFEHGSLHEFVANEKESCGCPPPANPDQKTESNEFPLAQSEGLGLTPPPVAAAPQGTLSQAPNAATTTMEHNAAPAAATENTPTPTTQPQPPTQPAATAPATPKKPAKKKRGFFTSIGGFFRRLFGAEQ
jgi:hypothetical protein